MRLKEYTTIIVGVLGGSTIYALLVGFDPVVFAGGTVLGLLIATCIVLYVFPKRKGDI